MPYQKLLEAMAHMVLATECPWLCWTVTVPGVLLPSDP